MENNFSHYTNDAIWKLNNVFVVLYMAMEDPN